MNRTISAAAVVAAALALAGPTPASAVGGPPAGVPSAPVEAPAPATLPTTPVTDPPVAGAPSGAPSTLPGAEQNPGTAAREEALERKPAMPGPNAPASAKRTAYGAACKDESKRPVKGERGSAFSKCVAALARVAGGASPRRACRDTSKKRVADEKGTPFSRCVKDAAALKRQIADDTVETTSQTAET